MKATNGTNEVSSTTATKWLHQPGRRGWQHVSEDKQPLLPQPPQPYPFRFSFQLYMTLQPVYEKMSHSHEISVPWRGTVWNWMQLLYCSAGAEHNFTGKVVYRIMLQSKIIWNCFYQEKGWRSLNCRKTHGKWPAFTLSSKLINKKKITEDKALFYYGSKVVFIKQRKTIVQTLQNS